MANRIGFTLAALRRLSPSACEDDARVLMKEGDVCNLSIKSRGGFFNLGISGTRELRLLAAQMIAIADHLETDGPEFEVVDV